MSCASPIRCVSDPDANNCDAECGVISAENIIYHVPCRLQCVLPDFTGLLIDVVVEK